MIEALQPIPPVNDLWAEYRNTHLPEVRDQLIGYYARIVTNVVARFPFNLPGHLDQLDLIDYGVSGLTEAIDRFDPSVGVKFETFARKKVKGVVWDAVRAETQFSRDAHERIQTISATYALLENKLGRPAEDEEVAQELGLTPQDLEQSVQLSTWLFLNRPVESEENEILEPGDSIILDQLTDAVRHLPHRERVMLALYYAMGLTMQEIAEVFHVTKPRICQIHSRALLRLRAFIEPEEKQESA